MRPMLQPGNPTILARAVTSTPMLTACFFRSWASGKMKTARGRRFLSAGTISPEQNAGNRWGIKKTRSQVSKTSYQIGIKTRTLSDADIWYKSIANFAWHSLLWRTAQNKSVSMLFCCCFCACNCFCVKYEYSRHDEEWRGVHHRETTTTADTVIY